MIVFYFDIGPNSKSVIAVDSVRFLPPCDDTNLSRLPGYEMDYSLGNVRGRAQACLRQSHAAHPRSAGSCAANHRTDPGWQLDPLASDSPEGTHGASHTELVNTNVNNTSLNKLFLCSIIHVLTMSQY